MSTPDTPLHKHKTTAKEHLAGIAGSRAWVQELAAAHLLRTQTPISQEPFEREDTEQ